MITHIQDSVRHIVQQLGYQIAELPLEPRENRMLQLRRQYVAGESRPGQEGGGTARGRKPAGLRDLLRDVPRLLRRAGQTHAARARSDLQSRRTNEQAARRGPGFSQRHENRARLKRKLLKDLWGEEMDEPAAYEAIKLIIADEVQARLEQRLILVEDIQRVLEYAQRTGRKLFNRETGRYLAYYKPTAVTYWVEYVPQGEAFVIFNAYSHRMEVPGSVPPPHQETGAVHEQSTWLMCANCNVPLRNGQGRCGVSG